MGTDFVLQVKCTIFWLKRGLRVHLGLYAPDCPKSTSKYLLFTKVVRKHGSRYLTGMNSFRMQCWLKELFWAVQSFKLFKNWFHMTWVVFNQKCLQNRVFWTKKLLGYKKDLEVFFWKIWQIQIQIHPKTYIEPKFGAFSLKNKVSTHGLVLLFQLTWRVDPPYCIFLVDFGKCITD